MVVPLHPITFGQSPVLVIKTHLLVMFRLTYNILYHRITMRFRYRKSAILLAPSHKFRK